MSRVSMRLEAGGERQEAGGERLEAVSLQNEAFL
jgi:hypothetical protein